MTEPETRKCSLSLAAHGVAEPCPGDRCAFWAEGGCAIERLGIDLDVHDLAAYLLDVRTHLEGVRDLRLGRELE